MFVCEAKTHLSRLLERVEAWGGVCQYPERSGDRTVGTRPAHGSSASTGIATRSSLDRSRLRRTGHGTDRRRVRLADPPLLLTGGPRGLQFSAALPPELVRRTVRERPTTLLAPPPCSPSLGYCALADCGHQRHDDPYVASHGVRISSGDDHDQAARHVLDLVPVTCLSVSVGLENIERPCPPLRSARTV